MNLFGRLSTVFLSESDKRILLSHGTGSEICTESVWSTCTGERLRDRERERERGRVGEEEGNHASVRVRGEGGESQSQNCRFYISGLTEYFPSDDSVPQSCSECKCMRSGLLRGFFCHCLFSCGRRGGGCLTALGRRRPSPVPNLLLGCLEHGSEALAFCVAPRQKPPTYRTSTASLPPQSVKRETEDKTNSKPANEKYEFSVYTSGDCMTTQNFLPSGSE